MSERIDSRDVVAAATVQQARDRSEPGRAYLMVLAGRACSHHTLPSRGEVTIGRSPANEIFVNDPSVSRQHARIRLGDKMTIEDLGSSNGTRLRDEWLPPSTPVELSLGDTVLVGSVTLVVQDTAWHPDDDRLADAEDASSCGVVDHSTRRTGLSFGKSIVTSEAMTQLVRLIERVAPGAIGVLIIGETGVGKEVAAEMVHGLSPRRDSPLLRLNCAALAESVLESELFGHEKGAFTGASVVKPGLLETASGGTVFLDEIGELSPAMQVKLLRVIEDRQVLRVGGLKPTTIDVRFVAATNRDLQEDVELGTFRADLYFRLNGVTLRVPPLRERVAEIEQLARVFLATACEEAGAQHVPRISPEALAILEQYAWPGNVRELRNVMERALLLSGDESILPEHLPSETMSTSADALTSVVNDGPGSDTASEQARLLDALHRCGGNQTRAAQQLGISRRTMVNRMNQFGLPRPKKTRR